MSGGGPPTVDELRVTIVELLAHVLGIEQASIGLEDRLIADLRLDSDDFSFWFVPALQERLGTEIPIEAWDTVFTVRDAVQVATAALREGSRREL